MFNNYCVFSISVLAFYMAKRKLMVAGVAVVAFTIYIFLWSKHHRQLGATLLDPLSAVEQIFIGALDLCAR